MGSKASFTNSESKAQKTGRGLFSGKKLGNKEWPMPFSSLKKEKQVVSLTRVRAFAQTSH